MNSTWYPASCPPPVGAVVIGYHPDWVDDDFNPTGVRECLLNCEEGEWLSGKWYDCQEGWKIEDETPPLQWTPMPIPPALAPTNKQDILAAAKTLRTDIHEAFKKFPVQLDGNVFMNMHDYNSIVTSLNTAFAEFSKKVD